MNVYADVPKISYGAYDAPGLMTSVSAHSHTSYEISCAFIVHKKVPDVC